MSKSKVNLVKYEYTFNKGNYESEKIGIELSPDEGVSASEALAEAKAFVHEGQEVENAGKKTSQKNKHTNDAPSRKSKAQKEEADEEAGDDEVEITEEDDEAAEEKPKTKGKKTAAKKVVEEPKEDEEQEEEKPKTKKKARGASAYDRTDDTHKKLFSEKLDQKFPDWRTKKSKMAKLASSKLNGTDFLDSDGDVIPEFVAALVKLMK